MRILIIKMSSLGDIIHTLPAITDIKKHHPNTHITWLVEPGFKEVPAWHKGIDEVITMPLRQLKNNLTSISSYTGIIKQLKALRAQKFDLIIDAQGLLKSAIIAKITPGKTAGLCKNSSKEAIASYLYSNKFTISKNKHAVLRTKELCANALNYPYSPEVEYGINSTNAKRNNDIILFHGTTWPNKHYPLKNWQELISIITEQGHKVLIPWGSKIEYERAKILSKLPGTKLLPKLTLTEIKDIIGCSKGAIGLDTGLSHLAAATATPCVAIYGPTRPDLAKNYGLSQAQITSNYECAPCMQRKCSVTSIPEAHPCMKTIKPIIVWEQFQKLIT